jgi:hypothetical protein
MDRHVSSANSDLNQLESMVLDTVSFEELLGHCNEVLKINQKYISDIEDQMSQFGYVPGKQSSNSLIFLFNGFYRNSIITPWFSVTMNFCAVLVWYTINKYILKENDQLFM